MLRGGQDTTGFLLRSIDGAKVRNGITLQQCFNSRHDFRITAGTENTIDLRHFLHNFFLITLGKTAGYQNLTHIAIRFQSCGRQNVVDCFGLSGFNKSAGVDHHHITAHNIRTDCVTGFLHAVHHPLAVHLIFGTAQ